MRYYKTAIRLPRRTKRDWHPPVMPGGVFKNFPLKFWITTSHFSVDSILTERKKDVLREDNQLHLWLLNMHEINSVSWKMNCLCICVQAHLFHNRPSTLNGCLLCLFVYACLRNMPEVGLFTCVCLCVCVFSMVFPPLCLDLKAPFSVICQVSCPLCLAPLSSAHPITAQWLIACLASKKQCVCVCVCIWERKLLTWEKGRVCAWSMWACMSVCVLGFLHIDGDPERTAS